MHFPIPLTLSADFKRHCKLVSVAHEAVLASITWFN